MAPARGEPLAIRRNLANRRCFGNTNLRVRTTGTPRSLLLATRPCCDLARWRRSHLRRAADKAGIYQ